MKKTIICVFMCLVILVSAFACTQNNTAEQTAEPTATAEPSATTVPTSTVEPTASPEPVSAKVVKSKYTIKSFAGSDGELTGYWDFSAQKDKDYFAEIVDGKIQFTEMNGNLVILRINATDEDKAKSTADIAKDYDAIGFYIENDSDESIGVSYFGEIKIPGVESDHQQMYNSTAFDDIECYLIDENDFVTKGEEFYHDNASMMDHGLCEIPPHFKGYFVCVFDSLGSDQCCYAGWGYHSSALCDNGKYVEGASFTAYGLQITNLFDQKDGVYNVGDYIFVDFE